MSRRGAEPLRLAGFGLAAAGALLSLCGYHVLGLVHHLPFHSSVSLGFQFAGDWGWPRRCAPSSRRQPHPMRSDDGRRLRHSAPGAWGLALMEVARRPARASGPPGAADAARRCAGRAAPGSERHQAPPMRAGWKRTHGPSGYLRRSNCPPGTLRVSRAASARCRVVHASPESERHPGLRTHVPGPRPRRCPGRKP